MARLLAETLHIISSQLWQSASHPGSSSCLTYSSAPRPLGSLILHFLLV